jgi:hypothetical protein
MTAVHLGFEVDSGRPVEIPRRHMAVVGQTQESGKTTTLEALVKRSGVQAIAFVTKRGETSFDDSRRIQPYFRDRADWQFVTSILDATLQEKNKFLRPWIMRICRTTRTLADVQKAVREALRTAKGINEGVYTQLDAYLDLIVPEIGRASLTARLDLQPGLNVMDVSGFATPMQMLFVQSAIDWVNEHEKHTVVLVPEAWEFIPEGKGSPVKASAVTLVRKGAALGNYIWVDSQDMAGVDKVILRGAAVWLIGVQREANEIKRNLANIPASIKRPKPADIARLERGQFFACWGTHCVLTYVQPAWMSHNAAADIARGDRPIGTVAPPRRPQPKEEEVNRQEAEALAQENTRLKAQIRDLEDRLAARDRAAVAPAPIPTSLFPAMPTDFDATYAAFKARLLRELPTDPALFKVLTHKPELMVEVARKVVQIDGTSLRGRVARLLAAGFFDDGKKQTAVRNELKRTGPDVNDGNLYQNLKGLVTDGFLTIETDKSYRSVQGMKVNVVER